MDYSVLERCALFQGISAGALRSLLESSPHHIQCYGKNETIFYLLDTAQRIGIILEGRVQAQKLFPNGSQVNVSIRGPGEMIGPAAVFSSSHRYPCDVIALEPSTIMMLRREDLLLIMQKKIRVLENFVTEIATATYMLQQKLELFSYAGIAQKAAFYLLLKARQTGSSAVKIPQSITKWAMIMNVSRPSLHRELNKLEQRGIIQISGHTVSLTDMDALQNVLGE